MHPTVLCNQCAQIGLGTPFPPFSGQECHGERLACREHTKTRLTRAAWYGSTDPRETRAILVSHLLRRPGCMAPNTYILLCMYSTSSDGHTLRDNPVSASLTPGAWVPPEPVALTTGNFLLGTRRGLSRIFWLDAILILHPRRNFTSWPEVREVSCRLRNGAPRTGGLLCKPPSSSIRCSTVPW